MSKNNRRISKRCATCGAQCSAYMCGNCARELHALLVGDNRPTGQPGILWYIERLKEQAYRQARLNVAMVGHRNIDDPEDDGRIGGYGLLVDHRATDLLRRIQASLGTWTDVVLRLCGPQTNENGQPGVVVSGSRFDTLDAKRARFLANNVKTIRLRCSQAHVIHTDMLSFAKQAYAVINRPPDNFCGKCPAVLKDGKPCETMLYTIERSEATVRCERCRNEHDVETLRVKMRDEVRDKLFSSVEIRHLMATRLDDSIPKSTFYQLVSDGRLIPRGYNAAGEDLFTYADVCAAREKPAPGKRKMKVCK